MKGKGHQSFKTLFGFGPRPSKHEGVMSFSRFKLGRTTYNMAHVSISKNNQQCLFEPCGRRSVESPPLVGPPCFSDSYVKSLETIGSSWFETFPVLLCLTDGDKRRAPSSDIQRITAMAGTPQAEGWPKLAWSGSKDLRFQTSCLAKLAKRPKNTLKDHSGPKRVPHLSDRLSVDEASLGDVIFHSYVVHL